MKRLLRKVLRRPVTSRRDVVLNRDFKHSLLCHRLLVQTLLAPKRKVPYPTHYHRQRENEKRISVARLQKNFHAAVLSSDAILFLVFLHNAMQSRYNNTR